MSAIKEQILLLNDTGQGRNLDVIAITLETLIILTDCMEVTVTVIKQTVDVQMSLQLLLSN